MSPLGEIKMIYQVVGLRKEKYLGQLCEGHNCDFEYTYDILVSDVLLLKDSHNNKYELTLFVHEGECSSGWTTASYGEYILNKVRSYKGKTHRILNKIDIELPEGCLETGEGYFNCDVFSFSEYGGCVYYPAGGYNINMDLFESIPFSEVKRPVHIFYGDSNCLKSYLAASLEGKTVLEIDGIECLNDIPDVITEDIIVVGNGCKVNFTLDEIKKRVPLSEDTKFIEVNFKEVL